MNRIYAIRIIKAFYFMSFARHKFNNDDDIKIPSSLLFRTSLPPIFKQQVSTQLPFTNTEMLVVPPPMSTLAVHFPSFSLITSAPAPLPER